MEGAEREWEGKGRNGKGIERDGDEGTGRE